MAAYRWTLGDVRIAPIRLGVTGHPAAAPRPPGLQAADGYAVFSAAFRGYGC